MKVKPRILSSLCWRRLEDRQEERDYKEEKRQRLLKGAKKKEECMTADRIKKKQQKITSLLGQITDTEAELIERERRERRDRLEMREISENLWKNWRGKGTIKKKLLRIPDYVEKVYKKL